MGNAQQAGSRAVQVSRLRRTSPSLRHNAMTSMQQLYLLVPLAPLAGALIAGLAAAPSAAPAPTGRPSSG